MDYATKHSPPLLLVGGYQLVCQNCGQMQQSPKNGRQKSRRSTVEIGTTVSSTIASGFFWGYFPWAEGYVTPQFGMNPIPIM